MCGDTKPYVWFSHTNLCKPNANEMTCESSLGYFEILDINFINHIKCTDQWQYT